MFLAYNKGLKYIATDSHPHLTLKLYRVRHSTLEQYWCKDRALGTYNLDLDPFNFIDVSERLKGLAHIEDSIYNNRAMVK